MLTYLKQGELSQDWAHTKVIQLMGPGFGLHLFLYEDETGQSSEQQLICVNTDDDIIPFLKLLF